MIFVVNDTAPIEIPDLATSAKRKPDIILVLLETLKAWLGPTCKDYTFDACVTHLSKYPIPTEVKRSWFEVVQFWELKATPMLPGMLNLPSYSLSTIIGETSGWSSVYVF